MTLLTKQSKKRRNTMAFTLSYSEAIIKEVIRDEDGYAMEVAYGEDRTGLIEIPEEKVEALMEEEQLTNYKKMVDYPLLMEEKAGKITGFYLVPKDATINWVPRACISGIVEDVVFV